MDHSHQQIHLSTEVLLETFKFLLKNDLHKCQRVTPRWKLIIRQHKHMLYKTSQMENTLIKAIACMKLNRTQEQYDNFRQAFRDLLLSEDRMDRKSLIEQFALIDGSCFLFDIVNECIENLKDSVSVKKRLLLLAAKILYFVSYDKVLDQLEVGLKIAYTTKLSEFQVNEMPRLFQSAVKRFELKKLTLNQRDVVTGIYIFCANVRLGILFQIEEFDLFAISGVLPSIRPDQMSDYLFYLLCKTVSELTLFHDELRSSIRHIIRSLDEFAGTDVNRMLKIQKLRR